MVDRLIGCRVERGRWSVIRLVEALRSCITVGHTSGEEHFS